MEEPSKRAGGDTTELPSKPHSRSFRVLALSGSLRRASSNTAVLRAAVQIAPSNLHVTPWEHIVRLPPFDPDREAIVRDERGASHDSAGPDVDDALVAVIELNARVAHADALLVACPEYARGVPGAFKNALDWLVGGDAFIAKPFALINGAPRASHAQASLRTTLETMSGIAVDAACVTLPLAERGLDAAAIVADKRLADPVRDALIALERWLALRVD